MVNMHRFEWNYKGIKNQQDYEQFVSDIKYDSRPLCNYEQAARLFYTNGNGKFVMIELQVPTSAMFENGEIHNPWLDAYEVKDMNDYDASNEIDSMRYEGKMTYDNAEGLMLLLAKEMCE